MKITIENYRGFDIEFDTYYEVFQCIATEENTKESKSYSAVKKFIDDYKKDNLDFRPFFIENSPESYKSNFGKLKIIGVRKDGRFVGQKEDGTKNQISDYDLKDYILYKPENEKYFKELEDLKELIEKQRIETNSKRKEIVSKMNIVNLKEFKESLK